MKEFTQLLSTDQVGVYAWQFTLVGRLVFYSPINSNITYNSTYGAQALYDLYSCAELVLKGSVTNCDSISMLNSLSNSQAIIG